MKLSQREVRALLAERATLMELLEKNPAFIHAITIRLKAIHEILAAHDAAKESATMEAAVVWGEPFRMPKNDPTAE